MKRSPAPLPAWRLLALWLLPARALRRLEPGAREGDASGVRSVAICLHGEARVIGCEDVWRNIKSAMLDPIRDDADVFVALKVNSKSYGPPSCLPRGDSEMMLRSHLDATFAPVATMFREKNDKLGIRTAGVPCVEMIEERERRLGGQYEWVMHLRTDMLFPFQLPRRSDWPVVAPGAQEVFVEDCAEGPGPNFVCKYQCTREPGHLGCVKDTWALMSRATVPLYYQKDWDFRRVHEEALKLTGGMGCVQHHIYQCGLGCVLHSHNVTIHSMTMRGTVLHNRNPRHEEVPNLSVASGLWPPNRGPPKGKGKLKLLEQPEDGDQDGGLWLREEPDVHSDVA